MSTAPFPWRFRLPPLFIGLAVGLTLCGGVGAADELVPDWTAETFTGNWGGARTRLSEHGITAELLYRADLLRNVSGGIERGGTGMAELDVKTRFDLEKWAGWEGVSAYLHVIDVNGGKLNASRVGSLMGVDNLEVTTNTTRLFHAWVQQSWADRRFALLTGLYPLDSEFQVMDAAAIFMHPSFGASPEFSQTGMAGPSVFPVSSLGLRAKWEPVDPSFYLQAALVDGVPGAPGDQRFTHVRLGNGDGSLLIVEAGYKPAEGGHIFETIEPEKGVPRGPLEKLEQKYEPISKYAAGFWRYTARFDDLVDKTASGVAVPRVNHGAYLVAEQSLFHEANDLSQGLAAFLRYGFTEGDVNVFDYAYSTGMRYRGLLPERDEDVFGIGYSRAHVSGKQRLRALLDGAPTESAEAVLEITYQARINPWLAIQPTLQRIVKPGAAPRVRDARIVGARVEITL